MSVRRTFGPAPTEWNDSTWAIWAVGLIEPLIDPYERLETLEEIRQQASSHRLRAATLLSGALVDIVDSLPDSDPWHRISPRKFGTWRDGTDLVPADVPSIREDIGLAALAKPLEPDAVRLMARTRHGWEAVAHDASELDDLVSPLTRAISWAAWRRRAYIGGDNYPVIAVFSWLRRAGLIASGLEIDDEARHEETRRTAKISDDLV